MKLTVKSWAIAISAIIAALFFAPAVSMTGMRFSGFSLISWMMAFGSDIYFFCILCFLIPLAVIAIWVFLRGNKKAIITAALYGAYILFWIITVIALNGNGIISAKITIWFIIEEVLAAALAMLALLIVFGRIPLEDPVSTKRFGKEAKQFVSENVEHLKRAVEHATDSNQASAGQGEKDEPSFWPFTNKESNYFIRGKIFLEDGEFVRAQDYFNRALDDAPKNGKYYLFLAMAEVGISNCNLIRHHMDVLQDNPNFKRFLRFATEEERELIFEKGVCPKCGAKTNSDMAFCCSCGAQLIWD